MTARERAAPEGRVGAAVRSRRVSSTQASMGRVSLRSAPDDCQYLPHPADRPSDMVVLAHSGNTVLPATQWHGDSQTQGLRLLSCAEG
jgi:hypothetical protein